MKSIGILFAFLIFTLPYCTIGQVNGNKILALTNKKNSEKIGILNVGDNVVYFYNSDNAINRQKIKGTITGIEDGSIFIGSISYPLAGYSRISLRKKGHKLGKVLIPVGILAFTLVPVNHPSFEYFVPGIVILSTGIIILQQTTKSYPASKWKIEVLALEGLKDGL